MIKEQPDLSIICPTYNQEKFIAQTLDSFLMQKTKYLFEIIVHDDASTDKTADIVRGYESKHPGIFSNIYQKENQFSKTINSVTKIIFSAARGKYLALCEGDDYWTDPYKIEKQIKFLEEHPEFVGSFHNTEERYDDDSKASFLYCDFTTSTGISFNDLSYRNCIPTCSVIFRKNLIGEFPSWYDNLKMGDWPLHLLNAQYGDYWYLPKIMGVHRLHTTSMWMLQDSELIKKHTIDAYDIMIKGFGPRPELQKQLMEAKEIFVRPPKHRQSSIVRRGVNYIKRIIKL